MSHTDRWPGRDRSARLERDRRSRRLVDADGRRNVVELGESIAAQVLESEQTGLSSGPSSGAI